MLRHEYDRANVQAEDSVADRFLIVRIPVTNFPRALGAGATSTWRDEMNSTKMVARSAGILYLLLLILGGFNLFYVPSLYTVAGDPAATAHKIIATELTYRIGILSDLAGSILFIFLALRLHALFKDVDKQYAMLLVIAVSVGVAFSVVNLVNQIAPLVLLSGANFLSSFTEAQLDALALVFLRLRNAGFEVVAAFWGLWLFPFGMLIIRSNFFPTSLGILVIGACFASLVYSFGSIAMPAYKYVIARLTMPVDVVGELSIAIWLLAKGARVALPQARP